MQLLCYTDETPAEQSPGLWKRIGCVWRGILREGGPPNTGGEQWGEHAETLLFTLMRTRVHSGNRLYQLDKTNYQQCTTAAQQQTISFSCHFCHHAWQKFPRKTGTQHFTPICCHGCFRHLSSPRSVSGPPSCQPRWRPLFRLCLLFSVCFLAMILAQHSNISDHSLLPLGLCSSSQVLTPSSSALLREPPNPV